jgi:hypothetical protein
MCFEFAEVMMKTKISIVIGTALISILAASSAFAGESRGGYVSHIATVNDSVLFKVTGGTQRDRPSCATDGERFAARKNSVHYQAIIAAFEMGRSVNLGHVKGTGTCSLWSNAEDLSWIEINRR